MNAKEGEVLAVIQTDLGYMKRDISEIKATVTTGYVSRAEYEPVKRLVYGLVGLMLTFVVGAILSVTFR